MSMLKLAVPSKGRLQEQTFAWFADRGITLERTGSGREYAGRVLGVQNVQLVLLSAGEIPRELAAGRIHMGVTGQDLIAEKIPAWEMQVETVAEMGFGQADLIIAVPQQWADVDTIDDLDAAAAAFRKAHGMRLRIATKYHNILRDYLRREGVADYQLVDSQGATEGTIKNLSAEAVADITSTGATLEANHLKILETPPILASQATLFASKNAKWSAAVNAARQEILERLGDTNV